jgi:multidrug efflux system membrane fusion protein
MPPLFALLPLRRMVRIKGRLLWSPAILLCLLALFTLMVSGCGSEKKVDPSKARRDRPVPVTVRPVVQKTVPVELSAIGNVEAYSSVAVKSRIGGELKRVHFREGQPVRQGDLILTIDPLPYEAALKQAQANVARTVALTKKADEDLRRYKDLIQKDYISQEQYDQARANVEALQATLKADQAAVENARLNLGFCLIHAPLTGVTGSLLAQPGAQIKANDDKAMVTINQVQPIYASFSVPEQYLSEIQKYARQGGLKVKARLGENEPLAEEGRLTFIDNTVDSSTGTIRLKGTFANQDRKLWPGQFVKVTLSLTAQPNALIIPSQALQTGIKGQYVFVVTPEQKAETRAVEAGRVFNGQTVIEKGLRVGEQVITDGQFLVVPGGKVQIKTGVENPEAKRP